MTKVILKSKKGHEIYDDSNFSVVCNNEANDCIVPGLEDSDGNPPTSC